MEKIQVKTEYLNKFIPKKEDNLLKGWIMKVPNSIVLDKRLSSYDKIILIYLKMRIFRGKSECNPSLTTISADLLISRRQITKSVGKLKSLGYVRFDPKFGQSNKYKINF